VGSSTGAAITNGGCIPPAVSASVPGSVQLHLQLSNSWASLMSTNFAPTLRDDMANNIVATAANPPPPSYSTLQTQLSCLSFLPDGTATKVTFLLSAQGLSAATVLSVAKTLVNNYATGRFTSTHSVTITSLTGTQLCSDYTLSSLNCNCGDAACNNGGNNGGNTGAGGTSSSSSSSSLSSGAIAGIVIGGVVGLLMICMVLWCFFFMSGGRRTKKDPENAIPGLRATPAGQPAHGFEEMGDGPPAGQTEPSQVEMQETGHTNDGLDGEEDTAAV